MANISPSLLSNRELLDATVHAVDRERRTTAELLALLAELDTRKLYLGEGYASLFTYCTQVLHLSEPAAYSRITAARAARRYPVIFARLAEGAVTLTTIGLLAGHLTEENHEALLDGARRKSKRDVERLVACLHPQPDIRSSVRRIAAPARASGPALLAPALLAIDAASPAEAPVAARTAIPTEPPTEPPREAAMAVPTEPPTVAPTVAPSEAAMAGPAVAPTIARTEPAMAAAGAPKPVTECARVAPDVTLPPHRLPVAPARHRSALAPLGPERYLLRVTLSRDAHDKLARARALLRHAIPSGDPAGVIERALTVLVEHLEQRKIAATSRPREHVSRASRRATRTRHVPAAVKRAVWARDEGRCAFVGTHGRCAETAFLEFHHVRPFAVGGATIVENLQIRCRSHNAHEAVCYFGEDRLPAAPEAPPV